MFGVFDKEYQLNLMLEEERQEAREEGLEEGRAEGREEGELNSIKKLMLNMKMTAEQAMDILDISAADRAHYLEML